MLTFAQLEAEAAGQGYIGTEHVLLGLMRDTTGIAGAALRAVGLRLDDVRRTVSRLRESEPNASVSQILPTSGVKVIIERAFEEARREKSPSVDTGHVLMGLLLEDSGMGARVLRERGLAAEGVGLEVTRLRHGGMTEGLFVGLTPTIRLRHLDLVDEKGNPITIDVMFPADYALDQEDRVTERIQKAVESGENAPKS